jgi:hypothetical protein
VIGATVVGEMPVLLRKQLASSKATYSIADPKIELIRKPGIEKAKIPTSLSFYE